MDSLSVNEFGELIEPHSGEEIHGMYSSIEDTDGLLTFFTKICWAKFRLPITFSILK